MTCGEGGMVIFQDKDTADRAAAWHDHGHENNPKLPRWEDSRSSSGFNYRMMELQGAVGLAQLAKLDSVIEAQRENAKLIREAIEDLPIRFRTSPEGAIETADALIFYVNDPVQAVKCRESLLATGLGTKILPEAYTWHFAGTWDHMTELKASHGGDLKNAFPESIAQLRKAVSLPVSVCMSREIPKKIRKALEIGLS